MTENSDARTYCHSQKIPRIPITPIETMAQTNYDVLIVGSGAGGGAALGD